MNKLQLIQSLRFFGFILIFFNHAYWLFTKHKIFDFGARGVEIFFLLSGFLIAYNYSNSLAQYNLHSSVNFVVKRIKKFYCLHVVMFLIMAVYIIRNFFKHGFNYSGGIPHFILDAVLNISLLQSWYDPAKFSFNGVSWFLSSIIFCYFCTPLLISSVQHIKREKIPVIFMILIVCKIILDSLSKYFGVNPAYRFINYAIGYFYALVIHVNTVKSTSYFNSIFQFSILAIYLFSCILFDKIWLPAIFILLELLLIYAFTLSNSFFSQIVGNKLFVHLGNISFELYIVHQVLINILSVKLKQFIHSGAIIFIVLLALSIVTAEFFYWKPVRNLITKKIYGE